MNIEEKFHWKEAICTGMTLFLGLGFIVNGLQGPQNEVLSTVLIGFALSIVSIAAFSLTSGWKSANDLPIGKKIVAYLPVLLLGVFFIALWIIIEIGKSAFKR